jgi:hypothetical protein
MSGSGTSCGSRSQYLTEVECTTSCHRAALTRPQDSKRYLTLGKGIQGQGVACVVYKVHSANHSAMAVLTPIQTSQPELGRKQPAYLVLSAEVLIDCMWVINVQMTMQRVSSC